MKRRDLVLLLCVLLAASGSWLFMNLGEKDNSSQITITVNGEFYGSYSLDEDQMIQIGDSNVCQIKDKKATMIEADCPDHLCMRQKAIDKENGGTIVCLPNKVVIEISKKQDTEVDSVAS